MDRVLMVSGKREGGNSPSLSISLLLQDNHSQPFCGHSPLRSSSQVPGTLSDKDTTQMNRQLLSHCPVCVPLKMCQGPPGEYDPH